jgi:hypothetical protein
MFHSHCHHQTAMLRLPEQIPGRELDGSSVRVFNKLVKYLHTMHNGMLMGMLPFVATQFARKVVLYMLVEDFA